MQVTILIIKISIKFMVPLLLVGGGGFEPPKLSRQIYSLIPLAAQESPQLNCTYKIVGGLDGTRTRDLSSDSAVF